eukprot:1160573-Pelagomonas_calceolata.AAC.38
MASHGMASHGMAPCFAPAFAAGLTWNGLTWKHWPHLSPCVSPFSAAMASRTFASSLCSRRMDVRKAPDFRSMEARAGASE